MFAALNRLILRIFGWRAVGPFPDIDRCVLVAAPHTSNWDFAGFVFAHWALGMQVRWLGKHTIFVGPVGWVFRKMGGLPVDRRGSHDLVAQLSEEMEASGKMHLALSPEGTRRRTEHWHAGFYHVAMGTGVPLVLASIDYPGKVVAIGPIIELTGDVTADMDRVRAFYADKVGHTPENQGPIRLRSEESESEGVSHGS